jgi:hypothetical protein
MASDRMAELFGSQKTAATSPQDIEVGGTTQATGGSYSNVFKEFGAIKAQITVIE